MGLVAASLCSLFALIFTGTKLIPLQSLFLNAGMEQTLLWVSIILTAYSVVGVVVWVVRRVMKAKSRPVIGFMIAALWFVGFCRVDAGL